MYSAPVQMMSISIDNSYKNKFEPVKTFEDSNFSKELETEIKKRKDEDYVTNETIISKQDENKLNDTKNSLNKENIDKDNSVKKEISNESNNEEEIFTNGQKYASAQENIKSTEKNKAKDGKNNIKSKNIVKSNSKTMEINEKDSKVISFTELTNENDKLANEVLKKMNLLSKTQQNNENEKMIKNPSIQLVSSFSDKKLDKQVKEITLLDAKKPKSLKKDTKLKIHDQRKFNLQGNEKNSNAKNISESLVKTAVESSGKEVEINSADNGSRLQNRTIDVKNIQTSVGSQLRETVNNEIVKQAGIVLKENGTGEIKLTMKPESLGKVRIHLSLTDNNIAGRIIVENNIVREIFESNLENLYKAFGSGGFENGGLQVSVQGHGGNSEEKNHKQGGRGTNSRNMQAVENSLAEISNAEWVNNAVNVIV